MIELQTPDTMRQKLEKRLRKLLGKDKGDDQPRVLTKT